MGRIDELVVERVPGERADAVRAFAEAYLRREAAAHAAGRDGGPGPEALFHELLGAFELAAGRDGAPIAVRALNPTRAEHGYEPAGSVLETNTEDLPFLVDSVSAELLARGLSIARLLHPIVGTERDPDGRIARVLRPAGAPAVESVMHFELDRRLSPEELADLEDAVRVVLGEVRRVVRDFDAMRARLDEMVALAREGSARYDADEVDEAVAFLCWVAEGNFIFLGAREYAIADGALGVVPGSGLGLLADEDRSRFARPVALGELDPGAARARAPRGPADPLAGERPLAGAPPRAHGLPRGAADRAGRLDGRGVPHARALHDEGMGRARERDAHARAQAAAHPRGRGPDRGLA